MERRGFVKAGLGAAALAAFFTGIYPPETPHRWRRNVIAWGAQFVLGTAVFLLGNRLW